MFKDFSVKRVARAGVIAAIYALTSLVTFPVASGAIQFRVSEAFTLLPLIFPEATVGLFIGCIISNLLTGCAALDVVFGSLVTLIAAILTYFTGRLIANKTAKSVVGGLFPVLLTTF